MKNWEIECDVLKHGLVCGVDEAGRGPLAGPVFAAAVILPFGIDIPGLDDSKKLSEKTRDRLFGEILANAVSHGIGSADHTEIDSLNILNATYLAMNRAIENLSEKPGIALIDGNRNTGIQCNSKSVVKGDEKSASIAAASVLAKVSRDRFMTEIADTYPQYGFEKHKGYPTKLHYEMLREHGTCKIHRLTFLKNTKLRGKRGEDIALDLLQNKGYTAVRRGYRSRFGEIDLIVRNDDFIVFAEVKLRKDDRFASGREFVTKSKQDKLRITAQKWLSENVTRLQPRFDVIEIYARDESSTPRIVHIENAF